MVWLLFLFSANHLLLGAVLQNASNKSEAMISSFSFIFAHHINYILDYFTMLQNEYELRLLA